MNRFTLSALALLSFQVSAHLSDSCAIKEMNIQNQIDYARLHQNQAQLAGLEAARDNLRVNCTETSLADERKRKIAQKQIKVMEREEKLAEAKEDGRAYKILKAENQLAEARLELEELKRGSD